ncbi:hypothetical protein ES702_05672 [subsurface metagenome]
MGLRIKLLVCTIWIAPEMSLYTFSPSLSPRQFTVYQPLTNTETPLLIPLTTSLYVPARPNPNKRNIVLVDVGTGFYVEKTTKDATKFYEGKVDDLRRNLGEIERVVGIKNSDLRVVEDVLRGRVLAEQQQQGGGAGGGGSGKKEGK